MAKAKKTRASVKATLGAEAPGESPKYDVAISFLAANERLVAPIADQLSERLSVFFFPRKELAGTNGLESMRMPFMGARVALISFAGLGVRHLGPALNKRPSQIDV